jgi:hypothetical protein
MIHLNTIGSLANAVAQFQGNLWDEASKWFGSTEVAENGSYVGSSVPRRTEADGRGGNGASVGELGELEFIRSRSRH